MPDRDVTDLVKRGYANYEYMPIKKCVCGAKFDGWDFKISIYRKDAYECPKCGRKFYFQQTVRVFEVAESPLKAESHS